MDWSYDDGGSGSGEHNDCVSRSITIAAQIPYAEVYERVSDLAATTSMRTGQTTKNIAASSPVPR